jgi:hypothetical protein
MPEIRGTVEDLVISRELGRFMLRPTKPGFSATQILYKDAGVDMIDPTEMVRRNWMIGLLQQSLTHGLEVTVVSHKLKVQSVTLHTGVMKKLPSAVKTTKGIVKKIRILTRKGLVTIHGATTASLGQSPSHSRAETRDFLIYADDAGGAAIHREESYRRNRVIGLLRQALADGLEVSVMHADKPVPLIATVVLHAKA